jgi:hypothetical protein
VYCPFWKVNAGALLIGFDGNGNPLEILYNVLEGDRINVFHAMKCRKAYLVFLDTGEKV